MNEQLVVGSSKELLRETAAALAHRGCCGTEHDPANGKLHGYCVVCGVPWPCETAQYYLRPPVETSEHDVWCPMGSPSLTCTCAERRPAPKATANTAICKTCCQEFELHDGHKCPGLALKANEPQPGVDPWLQTR